MLLEPQYSIEEGDIESTSFNISSHRLSQEEGGFGLREFEPTPRLDMVQVGNEPPPVGNQKPCCPTAYLRCDSISATKNKCGFNACNFFDDYKYYLRRDYSANVTIQHPTSGCDTSCIQQNHKTVDRHTCEQICVSDFGQIISPSTGCIAVTVDACLENCIGVYAGCAYAPGGACSGSTFTYTYCCPDGCAPGPGVESGVITETYSDEYTTAQVIDDAIALLPAYPDEWSGYCFSKRDLFVHETGCNIQRFRYKFIWLDPLVTACRICWIERTYDPDNNVLDETLMCEDVAAGETETSIREVLEPSVNGTTQIIFPIGACCIDGVCSLDSDVICELVHGGVWLGECTKCEPNPC